ncbi:hypothetical protein EYF80_030856 [Liparis tanakae]|uniref:Uncharacterized protein n=1 Tax=Liparis tanakae TaxID=230148 RepID=A0A4Z2H1I5_9TELE|nr:hypothetical protein EYF80_030856 [Liparis tanakae]
MFGLTWCHSAVNPKKYIYSCARCVCCPRWSIQTGHSPENCTTLAIPEQEEEEELESVCSGEQGPLCEAGPTELEAAACFECLASDRVRSRTQYGPVCRGRFVLDRVRGKVKHPEEEEEEECPSCSCRGPLRDALRVDAVWFGFC